MSQEAVLFPVAFCITPRYHLSPCVYHSPTGFGVGYGGSGPGDLALSILADHFGESPPSWPRRWAEDRFRCWRHHQEFKWAFITPMDKGGSDLTSHGIDAWLAPQAAAPEEEDGPGAG